MKDANGRELSQEDIRKLEEQCKEKMDAMSKRNATHANPMQAAEVHQGTVTKIPEATVEEEQTCMCQGDVFKNCGACACGSGGGCHNCCGCCGHARGQH